MSIFNQLIGKTIADPIRAIGEVIDTLFTSDEEKLDKKILLTRLAQSPQMEQIRINAEALKHKSRFVAGARPFILWVCGVSLALYYIPQYILASYLWWKMSMAKDVLLPYPIDSSSLMELVFGMLGLGLARTAEKFRGVAS